MSLVINDDNYEDVLSENTFVLVDFWAEWCGPCKVMLPKIDQLSDEYKDKIVVAKVDIDQAPEFTSNSNVRAVPAFVFFKDGEVVARQSGVVSLNSLKESVEKVFFSE